MDEWYRNQLKVSLPALILKWERKMNVMELLTLFCNYRISLRAHAVTDPVSCKIQVLYKGYKHILNIVMRGGMFNSDKEAYPYR